MKAGRILDTASPCPTLSEGTAGGGGGRVTITFETCRDLVDDYVSVSEEEIATELARFVRSRSMLIEGAAAMALASYRKLQRSASAAGMRWWCCAAATSTPQTLHESIPEENRIRADHPA